MSRIPPLKASVLNRAPVGPSTFLCAALVALLSGAHVVHAQIDTPAARESRAALRAVESTYGNRLQWTEWSRLLNVPDVRYELRAGDRAEPAALQAAILQLLGGSVSQFAEPAFARLAKTLDVRAQEVTPIAAADWPSACRQRAEDYTPLTPEMVEQARAALASRMDQFEEYFPAVRQPDGRWHEFLYWGETRALATPTQPAPTPDLESLARLETRWAAAPAVWEDALLFETSVAVRTYIRQLRGYLKGETREQHAAAWNLLAELLVQNEPQGRGTSLIAAAVDGRESLGQASRLTASIRRGLSHPNIVVRVDRKWFESQFAQKIDEPFDVDGVFAGTRSVGRGRMVGTMRGEILPSTAVGQWLLRLRGDSTSRASGSQDRVSVVSRATTRVAATKPFELDARGLTLGRSTAGANTSIVYESINAPGFARRRNAAISETYARRPQAEAESAAYARRSVLDQINEQAGKVAEEFNRSYHANLRDPRINSLRPGPDVRVRSGGDVFQWECLLEGPATFAAPAPAPLYDAGTDVIVSLAASALEEQGVMALAGKEMTAEELSEAMGPAVEEADKKTSEDFHVTFDQDPCDIRIADGMIHARLYVTKFDSADVKYPAMTVDVAYSPQQRDGQVVFARQGRVRVRPAATGPGEKPRISGRQQTLRVAVERKLSKVLTAELLWPEVAVPLSEGDETTMRLERAQVEATWLQIGLSQQAEG